MSTVPRRSTHQSSDEEPSAGTRSDPVVPPLENGDCLTAPEFERLYDALPGLKKAELLEGVVYVPSPVRNRLHARPHGHLMGWLTQYEAQTPGTEAGDNGTIRLDLDNEPQPDAFLRIAADCGGQSTTSEDDYVKGPPELVCEIASSSASYDLHVKLQVYRRSGVREYLVVRSRDVAVDWFVLREGSFARLAADGAGVYRSEVFPGLWLDSGALLRADLRRLFAVLDSGLASPEHTAFATSLDERLGVK